jgi:eukaryotic-like serine/threonine-protein kinase
VSDDVLALRSDSTSDEQTRQVTALPTAPGESFAAGTSVSRYVALEQIGRGGMGRVLRAYDPKLQREVALKEVRRDALDDEATARLVAEARAMAKLSHPHVVAVYDVEQLEAGEVVLVMEYVAGRTLQGWLRIEDRSWRAIVDAFIQAGRGLAAAHEVGLLHRDFKPANVLVSERGTVKVTDFGLAKISDTPSQASSLEMTRSADDLTEAGTVMGTPRYMAPEQHCGKPLTPAADQYAFCVALWEGLCGEPPFAGATMVTNKVKGPPAWPQRTTPRPVVEAIVRGLAPDPADRWRSMDALLEILAWDPARRRQRWFLGGAAIATLGLAGVGYDAWADARTQPCSGAEQQLAGVWDEGRKADVEAAFAAIDKSYAQTTLSKTVAALDTYAQDWAAMHTEACEATAVRKEQSPEMLDLRMACLHRAIVKLNAAVDVLVDADAGVAQRAHELTGGLRPLSRCADTEALAADVEPPLPEEAEVVETVRAQLARARTLNEAGRFAEAQQAIEAAEEDLVTVDYGPVRTELSLVAGFVFDNLGEYEASRTALEDAWQFAAQWGQWDALQKATTRWMFVVGARQQRVEQALQLRWLAHGLSQRDPEARAGFRSVLGNVLKTQGKYAEAETEHRAALALRIAAKGRNHPDVAVSRNNLARVLSFQGRYREAETEHRAALALRVAALGPDHPDVARSRSNLATTLFAQHKYIEAEAEHRAALALRIAALGPEHPDVVSSRNNLAAIHYQQGQYEKAEAEYRAAAAGWEAALGPEHPGVAESLSNLAMALAAQGKHAEAETHERAAVSLFERALGPDHPSVAMARSNLADSLAIQGKYIDAEAEYRAGLPRLEAALGADHPAVAMARHNLANFLRWRNRPAEALPLAEQAWTRRQQDDMPPELRAETAFLLARILWIVDGPDRDRARARILAEDAQASYARVDDPDDEGLDEFQQWLQKHGLREPAPQGQ